MKHLLLYCRPGFEREVAAEIQDRAIGYDCFGFSRVQEHSGYVRFECYGEEDADKLARLLPFWSLIFCRQMLVVTDELQGMDLGTASKDLPDKCQLIDKRIQELKAAEKKAD